MVTFSNGQWHILLLDAEVRGPSPEALLSTLGTLALKTVNFMNDNLTRHLDVTYRRTRKLLYRISQRLGSNTSCV